MGKRPEPRWEAPGLPGCQGNPFRKSRCRNYYGLHCLSPRPPISPQSGEGRKHKVPIFTMEKGKKTNPSPDPVGTRGFRGSRESPGSRPWTAARDLPSSRAGGQDDVSSQANSLKKKSKIGRKVGLNSVSVIFHFALSFGFSSKLTFPKMHPK